MPENLVYTALGVNKSPIEMHEIVRKIGKPNFFRGPHTSDVTTKYGGVAGPP